MSTLWYYASEDRQMGPVPENELDRLVSSGVILPYTLVWHEGLSEWQTYSSIRAGAATLPANSEGAIPGVVGLCSQCQEAELHSEMVRFGENWVCAKCKDNYTQRLREGTLSGRMVYASFWRRAGAAIIDGFILLIVQLLIQAVYAGADALRTMNGYVLASQIIVLQLLQMATQAVYHSSFVYQFGGTPGKLALGCRVVTADGAKLTLKRSIARYFASLISVMTFGIGYLIAAFDDERRTLHDRICDTRVIVKSGRFV